MTEQTRTIQDLASEGLEQIQFETNRPNAGTVYLPRQLSQSEVVQVTDGALEIHLLKHDVQLTLLAGGRYNLPAGERVFMQQVAGRACNFAQAVCTEQLDPAAAVTV